MATTPRDGRIRRAHPPAHQSSSFFLYEGRSLERDDRPITRVRVHPSVEVIGEWAFLRCHGLVEAKLCEGLERIDEGAFDGCRSLKRIRIPRAVRSIGEGAFRGCAWLERADLGEGLREMGESAFEGCGSLRRIAIPPSVEVVTARAFNGCEDLEGVDLRNGLLGIGNETFECCSSLSQIVIPSTVKEIGQGAFGDCKRLANVELREGLETIGDRAFYQCPCLERIAIPSTTREISQMSFVGCFRLASVELSREMEEIGVHAFDCCPSLRNIAIPPAAEVSHCFRGCYDMLELFGSQERAINALRNRFDGLQIHEQLYYQPYHAVDSSLLELREMIIRSNDRHGASAEIVRDCLGMTLLHVLACSSRQALDFYHLIVASEPRCLITEDKWGCPPILFAIWNKSPCEILQFLVDSHKLIFPNVHLCWDRMIETLCRAGASLGCISSLIEIQQMSFPEQSLCWTNAAKELAVRCLVIISSGDVEDREEAAQAFFVQWEVTMETVVECPACRELVQSLEEMERAFSPDRSDLNIQLLCEDFVAPLRGWWHRYRLPWSLGTFHFLIKAHMPDRLNEIAVRKWRAEIENLVKKISRMALWDIVPHYDAVLSASVAYKQDSLKLKNALFVLELTLWKTRISETTKTGRCDNAVTDQTESCADVLKIEQRVNCGANVIIPNVLQFFI